MPPRLTLPPSRRQRRPDTPPMTPNLTNDDDRKEIGHKGKKRTDGSSSGNKGESDDAPGSTTDSEEGGNDSEEGGEGEDDKDEGEEGWGSDLDNRTNEHIGDKG